MGRECEGRRRGRCRQGGGLGRNAQWLVGASRKIWAARAGSDIIETPPLLLVPFHPPLISSRIVRTARDGGQTRRREAKEEAVGGQGGPSHRSSAGGGGVRRSAPGTAGRRRRGGKEGGAIAEVARPRARPRQPAAIEGTSRLALPGERPLWAVPLCVIAARAKGQACRALAWAAPSPAVISVLFCLPPPPHHHHPPARQPAACPLASAALALACPGAHHPPLQHRPLSWRGRSELPNRVTA